MRQPGCAECEELWEDYTAATFEHVNIDSRMKMAELRQDVSETLTKAHDAAAEKREWPAVLPAIPDCVLVRLLHAALGIHARLRIVHQLIRALVLGWIFSGLVPHLLPTFVLTLGC